MKTLLLLSLLLASPALARIGETREQCEARYGKPVKEDRASKTTTHNNGGLEVRCIFRDGTCAHIGFFHLKDGEGKIAPLSETELTTLMNANSGDKPWKKSEEFPGSDSGMWTCGDLEATYLGNGLHVLTINTKAFRDAQISGDTSKDKSGLDGF